MHKTHHLFLLLFTVLACMLSTSLTSCRSGKTTASHGADTIAIAPAPVFDADTAMSYVRVQCAFGPRVPGSEAHEACAHWIAATFAQLGVSVTEQQTTLNGYDGQPMRCRNIMARMNPDHTDRVLITAHWDSRAWADNDPDPANHHTPVLAANDGASGVAVMLEMARAIASMPLSYGVDFVCFDLEDQGTPQWADEDDVQPSDESGFWCLGSRYWANQAFADNYEARFAVNLDMVGGRDASFSMESYSCQFAQPVVNMVWHLAEQLGYGQFFRQRVGGYVMDDHVPVFQLAHVPSIDIVPHVENAPSSFGRTWHTTSDTPDNIDPAVLKAVGQTLLQLLYNDNE